MEFKIEMRKITPGLKLKSIDSNSLNDAALKVIILIIDYCAQNTFDFKVKQVRKDKGMVDFNVCFDKRSVNVLVYDPKQYADADLARRLSKGNWVPMEMLVK